MEGVYTSNPALMQKSLGFATRSQWRPNHQRFRARLATREAHPSQPLTSGIFQDSFTPADKPTPVTAIQIAESDVISFHNYSRPEEFEKEITGLEQYHR